LIEVISDDLGLSWTITSTNIVGSPVRRFGLYNLGFFLEQIPESLDYIGSPALTTYTEVSPSLHYSGLGDQWTLFYGDRNNSADQNNQIVRYITFDARWAARNPTRLTPGQSIFSQNGVIGAYASAVNTSRGNIVILFDYESYPFQIREIFRMTGSYVQRRRRRWDE
jgi:hypothetical protein